MNMKPPCHVRVTSSFPPALGPLGRSQSHPLEREKGHPRNSVCRPQPSCQTLQLQSSRPRSSSNARTLSAKVCVTWTKPFLGHGARFYHHLRYNLGILWDSKTQLLHWVDIDTAEIHTWVNGLFDYAGRAETYGAVVSTRSQ